MNETFLSLLNGRNFRIFSCSKLVISVNWEQKVGKWLMRHSRTMFCTPCSPVPFIVCVCFVCRTKLYLYVSFCVLLEQIRAAFENDIWVVNIFNSCLFAFQLAGFYLFQKAQLFRVLKVIWVCMQSNTKV